MQVGFKLTNNLPTKSALLTNIALAIIPSNLSIL